MLSTLNARRARAAGWSASRFTLLVLLVLTSITVSSLAFPQISAGQAWTATWTPKTAAPVGPRGWVDGAYDSAQRRVMIFGGGAGSGIGDVWQYDTSSDQWVQLQTAPSCASGAAQPPAEYASAYDPVNQLLWMFGGSSVGCGGLSLVADAKTTSTVIVDRTLSATTPDFYKNWVVNIGDSIAFVTGYDPTPAGNRLTLAPPLSQAAKKGRYVLYAERGGLSGFAPATKTFTNVTGTTPEPTNRMSPALAYSTKDRALVMFGGQGGADTWAFDVNGKRWTQMTSSTGAPTPPGLSQLASSMVYDGDDDVFVLFGGCLCTLDFGASSGDTWTYRLSSNTWTKVTPAVSPPVRQGHHLVYDSANKRVILFGGFDATSGTYFNDVWIYSVTANTWSMVLPAVSPPARRMAAMVYDPVQQRTVLFGGQGPEALADVWVLQLQQSASGGSTPTLTSLSPSPVTAGSPGFTLTVTGANFASTSVVQWNGSNRTTTFVRGTQLQASIAAADIASAGSALVSASTPGSGGGTSNSLTLAIAAPTPAPILSSISPTTASAGGAAFTLTATGSNFTNGSIVQVNGASRTTTFVSSTQLTAAIPASDIAAAGTPSITVFTPAPGGGTSGARSLTVASVNPTPTITSLSPASVTAGSAAFTLTVTGTGFAAGATATVGGQARAVTVGSTTQVSIAVQATDVASQGTLAVVVTNPASCTNAVCASNSVSVTVAAPSPSAAPAPILSSISPTTASAGGAAFTLTATGSNFTSGSIVQVNGASRTTTFASSTQLTAAIPASDIAAAGTPSITVFTPAPGGGTSGARSLTVASVNPTPTITSLSPASVTAGSAAFTLTVTGTGFAAGATATVGGQARAVTVGSTTQVSIAVQATDVASQGTLAVVVTNPASCTNAVCASNGVNLTVAASSTSSTPTSPVLYFTDLASGPRSGNGDTSKGQIANQDGALVTVWGQNLGTSQSTSTITLGGVTPTAIYYWGNATPPSCGAATLFNTYRKLQCVTFQVDHATPPGAQNIVVTVNGIASNPVPFTVRTTGTIWFAASGGSGAGTFASPYGSIQVGVNALNSGDILYVKDGLNATGGIVVPRSSHYSIATAPLAIVAYPGAAVQVGDSTHDGIVITCSGCGYWMTYAKLAIFGASQAVTLPDNGRIVGAQIQTPMGGGAAGALGGFGSNLFILGDEFTNCGNPASFDSLYHVIYLYGRRSVATPWVESDREVGWSYFHGNTALRAINIYNGEAGGNNPITHHRIHDNVVVDQVGDGVLFGVGVVGENWEWNDLIINAGLAGGSGSGGGGGIRLQPANPPGVTSGLPITMHIFNNTVLNAGAVGTSASGALSIGTSGWTPDIHNNIFAQVTGIPYIGPASPAMRPDGNPAHWSNNLWYGAGAAPAGDSNALNADPKLVSAVSPYDLHLQATSPAIGAGVNMASLGVGLLDFDGRPRPASGAWGIGAYQASGSGTAAQASTPSGTGATTTTDSGTSGQSTTTTTTSTTSTGTTTSSTPPPSLTLTYNGMLRDVVGQSNTAVGPDGALDGTLTVTLSGSGGRTVTRVRMDSDGPGNWDTDSGTLFWVLGVAPTAGGALLNAPATMAVNFPVADGGSFVAFASDSQGIEFLPGRTLTLTATFSDGTTATAVTTVSEASAVPVSGPTAAPSTQTAAPSTQTFTRGQWTRYGTGNMSGARWHAAGGEPIMGGGTATAGQNLSQILQTNNITDNELFFSWSSVGAWDTDKDQFVSVGGTGDHGVSFGNSVDVWDLSTGLWNPTTGPNALTPGRPLDPTVKLFQRDAGAHLSWPAGTYFGNPPASPPAYIDNTNTYPNGAVLSHFTGQRLYPSARQSYDGVVYMPNVKKFFVGWGISYTTVSAGTAYLPAEWDPTTRKWEVIDLDVGLYANYPVCAWDSTYGRVLVLAGDLYAYYPNSGYTPFGNNYPITTSGASGRMRRIASNVNSINSFDYGHGFYDPKRKRMVLMGMLHLTGAHPNFGYVDLSGSEFGPGTVVTIAPTGAVGPFTNGGTGPGGLYDPIADKYVGWYGSNDGTGKGKSLYVMDPDTFVVTQLTPSSGADPAPPIGGKPMPGPGIGGTIAGIFQRFGYVPSIDAYWTINDSSNAGLFFFAPDRTSGPLASTQTP